MVYLSHIHVYTCHQFIDVTSCTGTLIVGDEHTQTVSASATGAIEQEADPEPPLGE